MLFRSYLIQTGRIPTLLDGDEVALDDGIGGHEVWSIRRGKKWRRQ
ncbi:MAG: hypothetical protein ACXVGA_09550 [Mycobacteriaceae bacterium]